MMELRAAPFDELAAEYDDVFTATALGQAVRAIAWKRFHTAFAARERLLEIGCGTGEDAVHLAQRGHRVLATDASPQMLRVAALKAERAGCADRVQFVCMPMDSLGAGLAGEKFDGIYSNFGAINCTQRIDRLAAELAPLVPPGAPLALVAMGRYVPWEWAWYLARGAGRQAFRRLNRAGVEWRGIHVSYPSPRMLADALRPHFVAQRASALGFALPPSYAAGWLDHSPRMLAALTRVEHAVHRWTALAAFADHYYLQATRGSSDE
jgi:ubiquinone/menaquinone biosynthesis C-methylase UbiE